MLLPEEALSLPKEFEPLTERQRRFVLSLFLTPTASDAARMAGYKDQTYNTVQTRAYQLMHNERVRAAILAEMHRRCESLGPQNLMRLQDIALNPGHRHQYKAIMSMLNFAGMRQVAETKSEVVHKTDAEQMAELRAIAERLGMPTEEVLGNIIDAEIVEETVEAEGRTEFVIDADEGDYA